MTEVHLPSDPPGQAASMVGKPRILVSEFMDPVGLGVLEEHAVVHYQPDLGVDRGALLRGVADQDALIVRNRTRVDRELLEHAPHLRVIGRLGAGLDNIDLAAARERAIPVTYARGANAEAVVEYVFGALLHLLRRLSDVSTKVRAGQWPREEFIGRELSGRTLGLLGFGEVGRRVGRVGLAFGMRVIAHDPLITQEDVQRWGLDVPLWAMNDVIAAADVLSLHLPLLPETKHLIGRSAMAVMRPGAIIVNAARGGVLDEPALAEALAEGRIAGAVLDVREHEPPPQPDPFASFEHVVLTPHLAGLTVEAQERVGVSVARDVLAVLQGGEAVHRA